MSNKARIVRLDLCELWIPAPEERCDDEADWLARAIDCPACGARKGTACLWARLRLMPSFSAHPSRRRNALALPGLKPPPDFLRPR